MIAYHVLCHDNFQQVARLVDALYGDDCVFLIDIDDGKHPDTSPLDALLARENVFLNRDAYIGWGGSGTLRKTIQGAFHLLDLNTDWQYYVVLSGQDLPLRSNTAIRRRLAQGLDSATSFIRAVEKPEIDLKGIPLIHAGDTTQLWADRGHTRVYAEPGTINPQFDMYARVLVDVTEVSDKGEVYIGRCDPLLLQRRLVFFRQYPLYAGANWFNIHRSVLEYMREDSFAYELYDVLRSTFLPDESFFQTYIKNSVFRDRTSQDYTRYIPRHAKHPRVKVFEMENWPEIAQSPDLFARKFDTRVDRHIVDKVLAQRVA